MEAFENLHKNTGENMKSGVIFGRLFWYFNKTKTGLWQEQPNVNNRSTLYFVIKKIERVNHTDDNIDSGLLIIFFQYQLTFSILKKTRR